MSRRISDTSTPAENLSTIPGSVFHAPEGVEVAELDRDGVIVAVNDAWERFSLDNGGETSRTGVGVSYLAVCDAAAQDPGAEAVAEAVRAAIRGELPAPMTVLIPCHAPEEQRFFDVLISSRTDDLGEFLGATVTLSHVSRDAPPPEDDPASGHARLISQAAQQRTWLESSTELTERLFAGTPDDPLALVLRHAAACAAADAGRVVVPVDEHRGHVRAQVGTMDDLQQGQTLDLDDTIYGRILHEVKPLLVTGDDRGLAGSPQQPTAPTDVGTVAGVPLVAPDGEVLAALVVRRPPEAPPFGAHDLGLLESFALHAALAVALDRARADRESLLMLTEHDRIAADLHDHVIQELFAIGMGLHGMVRLQHAPAHQQRLACYVDSLDQTIRRIRTTIFQLTHRPDGPSSLRTKLMEVVDDERPALGYSARIEFSGSLDMGVPDAIGDDVVAVLREALSNVARHAHASTVDVEVSLVGSELEVAVTDDGVGIGDSDRASGLASLRRRAESHEGTFRTWCPPTGGTELRWTASVVPPAP